MSVLDFVFSNQSGSLSLENPGVSVSEVLEWNGLPYAPASSAGVPITRETALRFHAVWRGVNLLGDRVGTLPVYIYDVKETGKEKSVNHSSYNKLLYRPNRHINAFQLKKIAETHRTMEGNAYIFCRRGVLGRIEEYILLDPRQTWPVRQDGDVYYLTYDTSSGKAQLLESADVIHLKGLGYDGLQGYSWTWASGESVGSGIATVEYGARFYRNNAIPAAVIEVPGTMSPEAKSELARAWNALHATTANAHKLGVLTNGAKLNTFSVNATDMQMIETRKWSVIEIANFLGLPPHKVGASERIAYNSLEQENQAFLDDALEWRLVDWEQELRDKVLTEREKRSDSRQILFDRRQLIRPNIAARAAYYRAALGQGTPWMTIDEVRICEDMNPLEGEIGDDIILPAGAGGNASPPADTPAPPDKEQDDNAPPSRDAQNELVRRALRNVAQRVARFASQLAGKPEKLIGWIDEDGILLKNREAAIAEIMPPLAVANPTVSAEDVAEELLGRAKSEVNDILLSVPAGGLQGAVDEWAGRFCSDAVGELADRILEDNQVGVAA